jgi:hypothetical protein
MANQAPSFEQIDQQGTLTMHSGTVGTTPISLPASATTDLIEVSIYLPSNSVPSSKQLLYSFDGGVTFFILQVGESINKTLRGGIKQIQIKGTTASVEYEVTVEKELS